MEKKQLNFSAPLLSVRRISSPRDTSDAENREMNRSLPPRKQHSLPLSKSNLKQDLDNEPGAIPFAWEHTPGKPKGHNDFLYDPQKDISLIPKLPPGRVSDPAHQPVDKLTKDHCVRASRNAALYKNDHVIKEKVNLKDVSDSDSGDDAYSDALETLSPGGSCSRRCDVSCLSGSDGPGTKPSGTFSTDPQIRDFIMDRFLPAAKAMTLETPQYSSRNKPVRSEPCRSVTKTISEDRRPSLTRLKSDNLSPCPHDAGEEACSDGDDDYCDDSGNSIVKACGLVPRFSFKNSLCLMDALPRMRARTPSPTIARFRNKNIAKVAWNADHMPMTDHVKSSEPCGIQQKPIAKSCQLDYRRQLLEKNAPFRDGHSRGGTISLYRNQSPRPKGFLGLPQKLENIKNTDESNSKNGLDLQKNNSGSEPGSPVVEKTLYIDSVNTLTTERLDSPCSSDKNGLMCFANEDLEELKECSHDGGPEVCDPSPSAMAGLRAQISAMKDNQIPDPREVSKSREHVEVPSSVNPSAYTGRILGSEDRGKYMAGSFSSPFLPPLPKSPSDSWLRRSFPSLSFKKPVPHSYVGTRPHPRNVASAGKRWETMVKTSNLYKDHCRYSEELQSKP